MVKELRCRNIVNLYTGVCKITKKKHLVRRDRTPKEVANWIRAAQKMNGAMEYQRGKDRFLRMSSQREAEQGGVNKTQKMVQY